MNTPVFAVVAPTVPLNGPLTAPLYPVVAVSVVNTPELAVLAPIAPV